MGTVECCVLVLAESPLLEAGFETDFECAAPTTERPVTKQCLLDLFEHILDLLETL